MFEHAPQAGPVPLTVVAAAVIEAVAALEGVPMRMTVFEAGLDGTPAPAAELADLRWTDGLDPVLRPAPAVRDHLLPLLRERGLLPRPARG